MLVKTDFWACQQLNPLSLRALIFCHHWKKGAESKESKTHPKGQKRPRAQRCMGWLVLPAQRASHISQSWKEGMNSSNNKHKMHIINTRMPLAILAFPYLLSFRIKLRKLISLAFLNVLNSNLLPFNTSKTFCFLQVKVLGIMMMKNVRAIINVTQERWKLLFHYNLQD